jgi:hypothetical protein
MQEENNNFAGELSRRGVLMGATASGLLIAGGGAVLAPSADAATKKIKKGGVLRISADLLQIQLVSTSFTIAW